MWLINCECYGFGFLLNLFEYKGYCGNKILVIFYKGNFECGRINFKIRVYCWIMIYYVYFFIYLIMRMFKIFF